MTTKHDPVLSVRIPRMTLVMIDEARGDQSRSGWFLDLVEEKLGPTPPMPTPEKKSRESPLPPLRRPIVPARRSSKKESFIASHVEDEA